MKNFFCKLWCFFQDVGYARAASTLAREGRFDDAKRIMLTKKDCEC